MFDSMRLLKMLSIPSARLRNNNNIIPPVLETSNTTYFSVGIAWRWPDDIQLETSDDIIELYSLHVVRHDVLC